MNNEPVFAYLRAKCPVCGKEFYKRCEDWGWMYGGKACCTYSCMRKLEREEQSSKKDKITKQLQGDSQYEEKKKRIRMPRKDGREISTEQKEQALRLLLSTNATYEEIGKLCRICRTKVGDLVRQYGIERSRGKKTKGKS